MNAENMTLKTELCDFLLSLKERNDFDVWHDDSAFKEALEAYRRGWILAQEAPGQQGETLGLHIFHLSETGYRIVEAYERAKAEEQPLAKRKRFIRDVIGGIGGWIKLFIGALIGALASELVRWLFG